MTRNFLKSCLIKLRKTKGGRIISCPGCCCQWGFWPFVYEGKTIPRDVPKGHLVVYVGENYKRFVIKISVLKHPLFRALLDQAQDEYDFSCDSKLCIPCTENIFLEVVRCASWPQDRRHYAYLCL